MKTEPDAWAGFWRDEPAAGSGATLANLPPELRNRLDAPWGAFATALPPRARVLDLATGGGVVLDLLRQKRRDLILTGVDSAPNLPKRPGMTLKAKIRTDRLPFADGAFDAVTSRFGIEYGPLEAGAAETPRVLRTGGSLCFLLHHADSNVLRHNRARRAALHWAAHESGWVEKALNLARARGAMALPTPPAFRGAPGEAAARYPGQSVAWEFLTGLVQLLDAGPRGGGEVGVRQLVGRADGELARLDALAAAACGAERLAALRDALTHGGIALAATTTVDEPDGTPLAWHLAGHKA